MSSAIADDVLLPRASVASKPRWIESARIDLIFFIVGPLLILPLAFGVEHGINRIFIIGVILAFPHYLSSLTFYFWDERRDYYRRRWIAFYAGPAILGAVYLAMIYLHVPLVVQFVLFFWNTFHVARQSCGILSIYRHGAGVHDVRHRDAANFAILSVSGWMALGNISTHPQVWPAFLLVHPRFPLVAWRVAGAIALLGMIRLTWSLVERVRLGRAPGLPEGAFLLSSILLFHPYLWMRDSSMATFAMLVPHYVQYMGMVWLVHRRKFRTPEGEQASLPQSLLVRVSSDLRVLLPILLGIGVAFYVGAAVSRRVGLFTHFETLYLFIAFQHFYLDGLFWAFRRPEIRSGLSPFLMRRPDATLVT